MTDTLRETIHKVAPAAQLLRLKAPPVVGGVLLGMEQILGQQAYQIREKLLAGAKAILPKNR
jgi:xanthosine utilization system XapX-like protein